MRLERLVVAGFLSVKHTLDLRIDPNVTVLLGPNDHGKSNVLAAISRLGHRGALDPAERNWDLPESKAPAIDFHFVLTPGDRRRALELARKGASPEVPKVSDGDVPAAFTVRRSDSPMVSVTGPKRTEVATALLSMLPSVELFEPVSSITDSVTADTIDDSNHEFMKGIFLYAGLKSEEWPSLFTQTDKTLMRLEKASSTLNRTIRKDWSQGQGLAFELRHDSLTQSITLHIKDPSVSSRWVRASEKSSGFTHYFSLRTRMYARSGGHPEGSFIWLFDEPGVWLHPAGQFDLMQAVEAIGQRNQVVYTTHSIFMINRNFPARHRLIVKSSKGTQLDAKPYASRWTAALDALGFSLGGSLLFAPCVLLTEGDSDPVLLYALLQALAARGLFTKDINSLAILAAGDERNAEAIARLLLQGSHKPRIAILVDGDKGGRERAKIRPGSTGDVERIALPDNTETEDYLPSAADYVEAVARTACMALGQIEPDAVKVNELMLRFMDERSDGETMLGSWAASTAKDVYALESKPSKLVAATVWADMFRVDDDASDLSRAQVVAELIDKALSLPERVSDERQI